MNIFGRPGSAKNRRYRALRLKLRDNDEVRRAFATEVKELCDGFGLQVPAWKPVYDRAACGMRIAFPGSARVRPSRGSSASPTLGSSPSPGGQKNGVWDLRSGAARVVRPPTAAGFGISPAATCGSISTSRCGGWPAGAVAR